MPAPRTPFSPAPVHAAAVLRAERRARLRARDIAAGLQPDMGADGPAALMRPAEQVRVQHAPGARPHTMRRLTDTCELDRLFYRANAALSAEQHAVGLRFKACWRRCISTGRLVQRYSPQTGQGGGTLEETEISVNARHAIDRALALLTLARARVVCAVCGLDEHPGTRIRTLHRALDLLHEKWR
ncbi:hypothetical protein CFR75_08750 [Komagataeibacter xylinus]|uniref:Uncharacterized protein n=1 Tax=Komagataeibacter xylinus TaxID=28448 RepID=A0A318PHW8_KOMXY|nr:hypothetical protein [Komagataeibacter xylinus]AZV37873.1 hypothetical protein CXP35_02660 [Komagataeibacter xylinus]PYD56875.1 hypothetical protein CFR75_08750 [Komagataeibacter xylinus]